MEALCIVLKTKIGDKIESISATMLIRRAQFYNQLTQQKNLSLSDSSPKLNATGKWQVIEKQVSFLQPGAKNK
jgi:hypothetical protein